VIAIELLVAAQAIDLHGRVALAPAHVPRARACTVPMSTATGYRTRCRRDRRLRRYRRVQRVPA
jgi:histidine ammonia-lyase